MLQRSDDPAAASLLFQQAMDVYHQQLLGVAKERKDLTNTTRLVNPWGEWCFDVGFEEADELLLEVPVTLAWELAAAACLFARATCLSEMQQQVRAQVSI